MTKDGARGSRRRAHTGESESARRLTSVTFVKPWPEPPGDTCNELINLIYRCLTEIQSQMRGTLIVRPLAADTIVYTVGPVLSNDRFPARFADPFLAERSARFSIFRSSLRSAIPYLDRFPYLARSPRWLSTNLPGYVIRCRVSCLYYALSV